MDERDPQPQHVESAAALFRAAFDANPGATWLLECETGRLLAVNEAALQQSGLARSEMEGHTLGDLRAGDDRERTDEAADALRADLPGHKPTLRSLRQRSGGGGVQELEVSSHWMAPVGGRRLRLCTVRDVTEQRRLERVEGRYQAFLETSREKVLFLSPDGRILDCNAMAEQAYGYSREELLKLRLSDLRDPLVDHGPDRQFTKVAGDNLRIETVHRRRDGTSFPVEVTSRATTSSSGERVLISVIRDTSDERRARAVLESVEQRLRLMLEEAPLAVLVLDRHGTVEYANPFFLQLTSRAWGEVVGKRAFGAFLSAKPETPSRAHFQSDLQTATGVRQLSWTQSILRDAAGAPEGFLYIGSDMTEQWHSERALRRSERRFRALIEGNPDAVALCSEGRLVYVNPALERLIGRPRDELLGKSAVELLHEGDREALRARLLPAQAPSAVHAGSLLEARLLQGGGKVAYVEIASLPVEADGGPAVLLVARDVTERWQMQSRLLQASRLASVGTLAAGVAHEINNPLAYVETNIGYVKTLWPAAAAELAARRAGSTARLQNLSSADLDDVRAALDESALGVERIRQIVHGLKEFARSEEEALRLVDVREALDGSLKMMGQELKHRARVVREIEPVPSVLGNEARLTQVFVNLLHNAAQALPPEGAEAQATVRLATSVDGEGRVVVSIEDTGCGIPQENLSRIFDPFFTTRGVGEGAGLGLSIAHGIVSGMGGDIEVTSAVGKGTTIRVILPPAKPEDPAEAAVAP
jgi:PAS domain S-box-containing protein